MARRIARTKTLTGRPLPSPAPLPAAVATGDGQGLALRRSARAAARALALVAATLYLGLISWYLLTHGGWPTPDYLIPPLLLVAIVLGRGWSFVFDWGPFLLLILSWQATAGLADQFGRPVHVAQLVTAEQWLFRGELPTLLLQERLYDTARAHWYDWAATLQHTLHFVLPVACGLLIWLRGRRLYWRYLASVMAVFYLGFAGYVLYPAAPPWMAGLQEVIPPVHRVAVETVVRLPVSTPVGLAYNHFSANQVAAMPSLHAALPLLLALTLIRIWGARAWPLVLYPITMGFNLVYLGEHYVIDVLAGYGVAVVAFLLVWVIPSVLPIRAPHWSLPAPRRAPAVIRLSGHALLPVLAVASIGLIAVSLRPGRPADEAGPVVPGLQVQAGEAGLLAPVPCDEGASPSLTAGNLLAPVAGQYAVYLFDLDQPACYTLSAEAPFPPPRIERLAALAALAPVRLAPSPSLRRGVELYALRIGVPSAAAVEAGLPPDHRFLLVVQLAGVADPEAATLAIDELTAIALLPDPYPSDPPLPPDEADPATPPVRASEPSPPLLDLLDEPSGEVISPPADTGATEPDAALPPAVPEATPAVDR